MFSPPLDALLKLSKTSSPQKLFEYDCVTLYNILLISSITVGQAGGGHGQQGGRPPGRQGDLSLVTQGSKKKVFFLVDSPLKPLALQKKFKKFILFS